MRISDWSSDVCSSDLDARILLEQIRRNTLEHDRDRVRAIGHDKAIGDAVSRFAKRAAGDHAAQPDRAAGRDALLCDIARRIEIGRSEEHTSELQSLMRISYAVFCLKKKKIHTQPNS